MQFTLRPWAIADLDSLMTFANNFEIAKYLTDKFPHPYTEQAGRNFIAFATAGTPVSIFAIEMDGKASGGIGLHPQDDVYRKNAELGYWLAEPFWGKGIITKAIGEIVDYGFKTFAIDRIYARPFGTNIGSQKALQKAGFTLEGRLEKTFFKNGEYLDELVYAIRKQPS